MRTTTLARPIESNLGKYESKQFTIDVTSKSFKVLLDTLYTNKILAIVRELSTNAHDSHIRADKLDIPFEISLPSMLSSTFTVRDFGVSLTHRDVMDLYTRVFGSDKDEGNEENGMFGLGSKSPFCYVDSFTVRAYLDGECRTYVAAVDEGGIPTITHVDMQDTDEPNGLEVSLPAQSKDFKEFETAVKTIAFGFDLPPLVNGGSIGTTKPLYADKNWRLFPKTSSIGIGVRQGCVLYPVESNLTNNWSTWRNSSIIIDVPIGTVEPAANRESLSLDDTTRANLKKVFTQAEKDIAEYIMEQLQNAPDIFEAEAALTTYKEIFPVNGTINYKGKPLTGKCNIEDLKFDILDENWEPISSQYHELYYNKTSTYKFIIEDDTKKVVRKKLRVKKYGRNASGNYYGRRSRYTNYSYSGLPTINILVNPTLPQLTELKRRLHLKDDQLIQIDQLQDYPPAKKVTNPGGAVISSNVGNERTGTYVYSGSSRYSGGLSRVKPLDIVKDAYWVPIDKGSSETVRLDDQFYTTYSLWNVSTILEAAEVLLALPKKPLYFLTQNARKNFDADNQLGRVLKALVLKNEAIILEQMRKAERNRVLYYKGMKDEKVLRHLLDDPTAVAIQNVTSDMLVAFFKNKADQQKAIADGKADADKLVREFPLLFPESKPDPAIYIKYIESTRKE
jgi:hypothetical protein